MGRARAWTDAEKAYLVASWPDPSLMTDDIIKHLGRTRDAVTTMAHRLQVKRPTLIETLGPEAYKQSSCWGKEFTRDCVDECPGWLKCMEMSTEALVKRDFKLTRSYRATVTGKWDGASIARAIREALNRLDQAEVIE
jgi:hypothetical protein